MFVAGRVAEEGGADLAERLEVEGCDRYVQRECDGRSGMMLFLVGVE